MLFSKEWEILNTKSINEGWKIGKVTREYLMDIYHRNSLNRKEMSLEQFMRALILVAGRMYQNCDINRTKPIQMLLNYFSVKDEEAFINRLTEYNIKYSQIDLVNCFRDSHRDVFTKMNLIKKKATNSRTHF